MFSFPETTIASMHAVLKPVQSKSGQCKIRHDSPNTHRAEKNFLKNITKRYTKQQGPDITDSGLRSQDKYY